MCISTKIIITLVLSELCQLLNYQWRQVVTLKQGEGQVTNHLERKTMNWNAMFENNV